MRRDIFLSIQEAKKAMVMDRVVRGEMTAAEGAARLGMSTRQIFRLKARVVRKDISSLSHGNRNRKPANAIPETVRELVCSKAREDYCGTSLAHMAELLERFEGVRISSKSIGRILKERGIPLSRHHRSPRKYKSRGRRKRLGELIQIDASPFDWLGTGKMISLHGGIDDATGQIVGLHFEKHECLRGYVRVLEEVLLQWGVPGEIYSDRHTIFLSPKTDKLSEEDEIEGRKAPLTQFGNMLYLLGIGHIGARTPQAKGRIERLWETCQHRLVVEIRLRGIRTLEEANAFLPEYMELHNKAFSVEANEKESAFLPCPVPEKLRLVLGVRDTRKASGGSDISWKGNAYQLEDPKGRKVLLRRGENITVVSSFDGSLWGIRANQEEYHLVLSPLQGKNTCSPSPKREKKTTGHKPSPDHPWRKSYKTNLGNEPFGKETEYDLCGSLT